MSGFIDSDAPYPDGCGPDCKGCDPCVCGHPWSDHGGWLKCLPGCTCKGFDSLFKARVVMPSERS